MQAVHWHRGRHKVPVRIREYVAEGGCNLSIFPKEPVFVSHLHAKSRLFKPMPQKSTLFKIFTQKS